MELNENVLQVLRNFATINQNILIKQGNEIRTISEARNVLAKATVDVDFPRDFAVYDLGQFISVLSLVDKPNLEFEEKSVSIKDSSGLSSIKYFFASPDTITTSEKDISMPEAEVKFILDEKTLAKLRSASSALGYKDLIIRGSNNLINLSITENENSTANSFNIDVPGSYQSEDFKFILNIENLKIVQGNYDVNISSKFISNFTNKTSNIQYWIALEKTSTYRG
jgi:hypothetical protein